MGGVAEPQGMVSMLDDDFSLELFEGNSTLVPSPFMTQVLDHLGAQRKECSVSSSFQEMGCGLVQSAEQVDAKAASFCVRSFYKTGDDAKVLALGHQMVDPELRQWITEDSCLTRMIAAQSQGRTLCLMPV